MKKTIYLVVCLIWLAAGVLASEPSIWGTSAKSDFLRGEAHGVSILDTGEIVLSPKLSEVYNSQQSYVWSSAVDSNGNVFLGTGNEGRIYKVGADGKAALFYDSNELDVSALTIGKDGALYAGTSPDGKVYRIEAGGKAEVFFDPEDKYIWSLAAMNDGNLAVGTGENGKIYRVKTANARPEESLFYDSTETHIICLAVDKAGNLVAGTDANGLVLRISNDGKAFALLDAPLRETHEIKAGADGSLYVLVLSEQASSSSSTSTAGGTVTSPGGATVTISSVSTISPDDTTPARSRNDLSNAKSAVYRILPDGGNDIVWSSTNVTAFSIFPNSNGVFIGTSDKGRIYSVTNDGRETLLLQTNEGQISTFTSRGGDIFSTSSNQGKLFKFNAERNETGSYESSIKDGKTTALWGRIWWRSSGQVELQTRSGNTEKPDGTWSDWSVAYKDPKGVQIQSPKARFLQWRAVLRRSASTASDSLQEVSISFLPRNIAPEVLSIQILPTNVGLQSSVPPVIDPNIENSGLDPMLFGIPPANNIPPRRLYQRNAISLQWTAEDRNGDKLEYSVYYRGVNEQNFRLLKNGLRETFFTLDGAALSDGHYIFKVVVSDSPSNPINQALSGERISEPIDVDNTPPIINQVGTTQIVGDKIRVVFEAADSASFVKNAEMSLDGLDWQTVFADDGISDSSNERFTLEVPVSPGEHTISLRVFDASGNIGSIRISAKR